MRARALRLVYWIATVWTLACVPRSPAPLPVAPPQVVAPPPAAVPPPSGPEHSPVVQVESRNAALLDSGELIVGHREALVAFRADGTGHRVISPGPALYPRRYGSEYAIVLRPLADADLRAGMAIDLVALATGERREVGQVPAFQCAERAEPVNLSIHEPLDLEVDTERGVACIGLSDATANAAQVRVRVRVDLRKHELKRWLVVGETNCTPPEGVELGDPSPDGACWNNPIVAQPSLDSGAFPFLFDEEHVYMPAAPRGGAKSRLRGYQLEEPAPSGRWLLLAGDYQEREVVYRRLVLLDRSNGKLYPIPSLPGLWPPPLTAARGEFKTPIREAQLYAAASDVRWLAAEVLVLDTRVVRPGERVFDVTEGTFAR